MTDFVTTNGLEIPEIGDNQTGGTLLGDLSAEERQTLDANLDTEADAPMGQINGIMAERFRQLYELAQVAFNGFDPDAAEDFLLDAICAITGTIRASATASFFGASNPLSLNLDSNSTVAAGSLVSVLDDPGTVFALDADVTSTTAGNYPGFATCTVKGRKVANATTLTVIQTPTVGWNAVANPTDAIVGQERDTDPELRVRRLAELEASGAGTVDTIQAKVSAIENPDGSKPVLDCKTYENVEDYISPEGIPPHSVETVIYDGPSESAADNDVAQAIWNTKGAGISAFGSDQGIATDKFGNPQRVAFSRAAIINGKIAITVNTNVARPNDYAGDVAIKAAIVARVDLRAILGVSEIRPTDYVAAVLATGPDGTTNPLGVIGVTNLQIGNVLAGYNANLQNFDVPFRTKFLLDTSNITITRVPVVP